MTTRTSRGTWRVPLAVALFIWGLAGASWAARPTGLRYPLAGTPILNPAPQVAWAPGELGLCACTLSAVGAPAAQSGLELEFYRGSFGGIPDFTQISPVQKTVSANTSIASFANDDLYALRFTGRIDIPVAGSWVFTVTGDDAARLFIDGTQRVSIDGLRTTPSTVASASITLTRGFHTIEVQYVRNGNAGVLDLLWQGPGIGIDTDADLVVDAPEPVPSSAFSFVPALSAACSAASGQSSCTSDDACGAGFFCTASPTDAFRAVGICQPVAQTPLCVASTECGNDAVCVSPTDEGGVTLTEASFSCPPDEPGCDLDGGAVNAPISGVATEFFRGLFTALPDFDQLVPLEEVVATKFVMPAHAGEDGFAYRMRAFVDVPIAGTWDFFSISDEGSKVLVDGDLVVSNDFLHGAREAQGSKFLSAGKHEVEVQYFERFGSASLRVDWQLRDANGIIVRAREEIPTSVLSHTPSNRITCSTDGLSCAPPLVGELPREVDHLVDLTQVSTVRGVTLRQRVQRARFKVAPRVNYSVEVSRTPTFGAADLLLTSSRQTGLRLPFTQTTGASLLERREAEAAQLIGSCGQVNVDGIIFEMLCSGSGAVTLTFNAPSTGTYLFRTRVTGDQTFGGTIAPGAAVNDPVLVQFRLDSTVVAGIIDDPLVPAIRRGLRAVTANRSVIVPATGKRETQELLLELPVTAGPHSITMQFINDFCCTPSDRNLMVDFVEIAGPSETQTVLAALSQGPVFWRTRAFDGQSRSTVSSETRLIDMPDLTPPKTPIISYPEEAAIVLSTSPAVSWAEVPDATGYEVTFTNSVTGQAQVVTTTATSIDGPPSPLERGDAVTIEVSAVDQAGNRSPPSSKRRVVVSPRISYKFQASRDAAFTPQGLLFEGPSQSSRTFGPLNVPAAATFSTKISSVGPLSSGSDCGVTGDGYQLLCGGNQRRDHAVLVPTTGEYVLTFDAFQSMGGPDDVRMEVLVDLTTVDTITVPNLRAAPGTFRVRTTLQAGNHTISVRFTNDFCCANTGRVGETGDRNLFIRSVSVDGPANVPTLGDLFALGPLFWRTVAVDGFGNTRTAAPTHVVEFPDRTPPTPPRVAYPEDAAVIVSQSPSFLWDAVSDAVAYDIVVTNGVQELINRRVTDTLVDDLGDLPRGDGFIWTVRAVDQAGNTSTPVQRTFRIAERVTYDFLASTSPTFTPESVILKKEGLTRPRLETGGLSSQAVSTFSEVETLEGTGCGLRDRFVVVLSNGTLQTVTDGNKYQVLCTQAQNRVMRFQAPETGLYRVRIFASADQVPGTGNAVMALTGGRRIEVPITVNYNDITSTFPGRQEVVVEMPFERGLQALKIEYANEFCCSPGDRNLLVDNVQIDGPLNDSTVIAALSQGPVFWTAVANDGTRRSNQPNNAFVVAFPDLVPPRAPKLAYPEVGAVVLDLNPSFMWPAVTDAVSYRVSVTDLSTTQTTVQTTTDTQIRWPDAFLRGTTLEVTVSARDAAGNESVPSSIVRFSIANRVNYRLQASLDATFSPAGIFFEEPSLGTTRLGPLSALFVDPPVSITKKPFDPDVSGNNCGSVVAGGQIFVNLCGQDHFREYPIKIVGDSASYEVTMAAFGVIVNGEPSKVEILIDGISKGIFDADSTSASPQTLRLTTSLSPGGHTVRARYTNEFCCSPADRNLFVGNVTVAGPVGNETVLSRMSQGDVFWRVLAEDGLRRARDSETRLIGFPDLKPPQAPVPVYPEVGAVVLSQAPAILVKAPFDATRFRILVREANGTVALDKSVTSPLYNWDEAPLVRGRSYTWTVTAFDAAGNESVPSAIQPFSVDHRVRYTVEASEAPPDALTGAFAEADIITRVGGLLEPRLPLSGSVADPINITAELETGSASGTSCGVASGSGRNWVNICSNGTRASTVRIAVGGTYRVTATVSGTQTLPIETLGAVRAAIVVDGSQAGQFDVTKNFPNEFEEKTLEVRLGVGVHSIGVGFLNDFCCTPVDRNLLADKIVVEGPVGNSTFSDLFSRGDVWWRVRAVDGIQRETRSTDTRVIAFPDLLPPDSPKVIYPEENASLLSSRPAFQWSSIADASRYQVRLLDLDRSAEIPLGETTSNTLALPSGVSDLLRGGRYSLEVRAFDPANNPSVNPTPISFSIADRVTYDWEVATTPNFRPESQLVRLAGLTDTTLESKQPSEPLFTKKVEAEGSATAIANHCGASGGFANLCTTGSEVGLRVDILGASAEYNVNARVFATQSTVGFTQMEVRVDGSPVFTVDVLAPRERPELRSFKVPLNPGPHLISVRFPNEQCCAAGDRNLFVDFIEVSGPAGLASIESKLRVGPVFWRVTARDGIARASDATNPFLVDFPDENPPVSPIPIYPEDSATILSTNPGFRWSPILDAASYRVVVIDEATALQLINTDVPAGQEFFNPDGAFRLERRQRYRWFVEAVDAAGNRSPDPAQRVFTVGDRVTYEVQLATSVAFSADSQLASFPTNGLTRKQFRTIDLPQAGVAFYRVVAKDGVGASSISSPTHTLSLPDNKPPTLVSVLYPEDGVLALDATPGFVWSEREPGLEYEFEIGTSSSFPANTILFKSRARGNVVELPASAPLLANNVYFWHVRGIDAAGNVGPFTNAARLALRTKIKSTYKLEVATQSFHLNPTPTYVATTTATNIQLPATQPLQENTTYFWRVTATKTVDSEPPILRTKVSISSLSAANAGEALSATVGRFVPEPGGVIGNYFKDREFRIANGLRQDTQIDFPRLADGDPFGDFGGLTGTNGDSFSVRWTGLVFAPRAGTYKFIGIADDNQQLIINGTRLFGVSQFLGAQRADGTINLTEGWHFFAYEMVENTGAAFAQLSYRCDTCSPAVPEQVIPSEFLAIPRSNTDNKAPVVRAIYLASAMPSTSTTPGRATLHLDLNEAATVEVTIVDDGVTRVIPPARVGVTHDIELGNVKDSFTYRATLTDLNNNSATTADIGACAPLESDLTRNELRASYFSETNLTGRVLDEAQATINYTEPSAAASPLVGVNDYSIRWHGGLFVASTDVGANRFALTANDGQRFTVDGLTLSNDFVKRGAAVTRDVQVTLAAGWHELDFAYLQGTGDARALIARTTPGGFTQSPLPNSALASVSLTYLRPTFSSPGQTLSLEATSPQGTLATLTSLTATDCRDPSPTVANNAPGVFPLGTTNVAWTARNRFNEATTTIQAVRVVDTTPPRVLPITDQVIPCNSPNADGRTPADLVTLATPSTQDNADPNPQVTFIKPSNFVLDEPTDVTVVARDFSGNESRSTFKVTSTDVGALSLALAAEVTAGKADDCTLANNTLGTLVRLPQPVATNLCLASSAMTLTHDLPAPTAGDPSSDEICVPAGTSVVRWTARVGTRVGQAEIRVRVFNTAFVLVVDAAPSGYVNTDADVRMHLACRPGESNCFAVFDAAGVRRVSWRVISSDQPQLTEVGDAGTFRALFTSETRQCPLNVVVVDAVGRQGATQEPCFAIDKTVPSVSPGDLPQQWVSPVNYTEPVDAVASDVSTWPHGFVGEDINLTLGATDNDGLVASGIRSLVATMTRVGSTDPPIEVFRSTPAALADGLDSGPAAVLEFCTSALCTNGKLDLAKLGLGNYQLHITTTDAAGNTAVADRFLSVRDLFGALDALFIDNPSPTADTGWLALSNFNQVTNVREPRDAASKARTAIPRTRTLLVDVPPQAVLSLRGVADDLASSNATITSFLRVYLARAIASEVARLTELHEAEGPTDWNLFGSPGRYLSFRSGSYNGRQHIVSPSTIFGAVRSKLVLARAKISEVQPNASLLNSAAALDELSLLVDDRVVADFYGREPFYLVDPTPTDPLGVSESFYENAFATSSSSDYGRQLATVVERQIDRAIDGPGVPVALKFVTEVADAGGQPITCADDVDCGGDDVCNPTSATCFTPGPFRRVSQRVGTFRAGVEALDCRADRSCSGRKLVSNLEFLDEIYTSVQDSFGDLGAVQDEAFATHTWRQGIGMTLLYVLNFTIYTGEEPLIVIAPTDPITATSECWWARMAESLDGGDAIGVDDALSLFEEGRCLNVEIYNKFYGGAQRGIVEDVCVNPEDYGCPTDELRHANAGNCLRVTPSALPSVQGMCGPLSP